MLLDDWMIFVTKLEHSLRDADSRLAMLTYYCDQMVPSLHLTASATPQIVSSCVHPGRLSLRTTSTLISRGSR